MNSYIESAVFSFICEIHFNQNVQEFTAPNITPRQINEQILYVYTAYFMSKDQKISEEIDGERESDRKGQIVSRTSTHDSDDDSLRVIFVVSLSLTAIIPIRRHWCRHCSTYVHIMFNDQFKQVRVRNRTSYRIFLSFFFSCRRYSFFLEFLLQSRFVSFTCQNVNFIFCTVFLFYIRSHL